MRQFIAIYGWTLWTNLLGHWTIALSLSFIRGTFSKAFAVPVSGDFIPEKFSEGNTIDIVSFSQA